MVKLSGDYGSQQTTNGVVEILSPMAFIWRRAISWGGTSALTSDGTSITFTNTNLPKEGELVKIASDGTATQTFGNLATTDSGTTSVAMVWTGYEVADSGAQDTFTIIDGAYYLFELSSDRINSGAAPAAGTFVYYSANDKKFQNASASGSYFTYKVGVCEGTVTRNSATYYRIRWNRAGDFSTTA